MLTTISIVSGILSIKVGKNHWTEIRLLWRGSGFHYNVSSFLWCTISVGYQTVVIACGNCTGGVTAGSHINTLHFVAVDNTNRWDLLPVGSTPVTNLYYFGPTGPGYACMDHRANLIHSYQRPALYRLDNYGKDHSSI